MAYCVRGAVTCAENSKEMILSETKKLLLDIISKNEIKIDDILAVFFTATNDLDKVYPAVAAREIGITEAALMCFQEMHVEGSLEKCVRVGVLAENGKSQREAVHVYIGEAAKLRPDLKR
jgi:monofunctional chorismate mutase